MKLDRNDLAHVVHPCAVYFVLRESLRRETFAWALRGLESRAARSQSEGTEETHWTAIQQRMMGASRWDTVIPRYTGQLNTAEEGVRQAATLQTVSNIMRLRPYVAYTVDNILYTLDLFNPANELDMSYARAGEPVLALLLEDTTPLSIRYPRTIRDRLAENRIFYEILKDLDGILQPEHVCGIEPNIMFSLLHAYDVGRANPRFRPWEFLWPLHVLRDPPIPLTPETRISGRPVGMMAGKEVKLARVDDWGGGRVLIQIEAGIRASMSWEYFAVAKALGMIAVQQLVEGTAE